MHDQWATIANAEAATYVKSTMKMLNIHEVIIIVALGAMAYWKFPIAWIVAVGFALTFKTLGGLIIDGFRRLDAGRAYLEQCSSAMDYKLDKLVGKRSSQ